MNRNQNAIVLKTHYMLFIIVLYSLIGCTDVKITGLDSCIKDVEATIKQGSKEQKVSATVTKGEFKVTIANTMAIDKKLEIRIKVKTVQENTECKELEAKLKLDDYWFSGKIPTNKELNLLRDLTQIWPDNLPDNSGVVEAGTRPIPPSENRGEGEFAVSMWAKTLPGCEDHCWEQWIKGKVDMKREGDSDFREILHGISYRTGTSSHKWGSFGLDLPQGSNTPCIAIYDIPGKPGKKGIIDAPGFNNTKSIRDNFFLHVILPNGGTAVPSGNKIWLRHTFEAYSLLLCKKPIPIKTLGNYYWKVVQLWEFEATDALYKFNKVSYQLVQAPQWTNGITNIPNEITSLR